MKAPSEDIYSKSTICDFLLMVSIVVTEAVLLTVCEIFLCIEVEYCYFCSLYSDC